MAEKGRIRQQLMPAHRLPDKMLKDPASRVLEVEGSDSDEKSPYATKSTGYPKTPELPKKQPCPEANCECEMHNDNDLESINSQLNRKNAMQRVCNAMRCKLDVGRGARIRLDPTNGPIQQCQKLAFPSTKHLCCSIVSKCSRDGALRNPAR